MRIFFGSLCVLFLSCSTDTGQERVRYPISVQGIDESSFAVDDWAITLAEAKLAFGPVYFCATRAASAEQCPTALAEFADVAVVDLLDPTPLQVGEINGLTGVIQSTTFDYGISWRITESAPKLSAAAPEGHSLVLRGSAQRGAEAFDFEARVDVAPFFQGTQSVQGVRVDADVVDSNVALTVQFDPRDWASRLDFDALAALGEAIVQIEEGSSAYNALVIAMSANLPPTFIWSEATQQ